MPLTPAQAKSRYIINSVIQYLTRTAKAEYDAVAAAETWNTALKIAVGNPDDPDVALNVPKVAVGIMESKGGAAAEIGSSLTNRFQNFVLYCYPALDNGQPSKEAMFALEDALRNALGTEYIRVIDYGNPNCNANNILFTGEVMRVVRAAGPMPRGNNASLAQERNRFDMYLQVSYPVQETMNT